MLRIMRSRSQLDFSQLMHVYEEGNISNGRELYPHLSYNEQLCMAEQDFYQYLMTVFFRQKDSFYAVWESEWRYRAALRIEPYSDGLLLCALETAPDSRDHGYATALVHEVLKYLSQKGSGTVYSHVSKRNQPSLAVHKKCGFEIIKDYAVYSDGSVIHNCFTLANMYKESET